MSNKGSWVWIIWIVCAGSRIFSQEAILLEDVRIFNSVRGEMSAPQNILIEKGRIKDIGNIDTTATRIDCSGKFALPGLCDCHTHLATLTTEGAESEKKQLRAFVEGGVVFVRDVGGPVNEMNRMHRQIADGELVGPEIFYCGPMLEKSPLHWAKFNEEMPGFTVAIDTKEDVDRILPDLANQGATLIKTFNKQDPEVYAYLVTKAKELSLQIVHDPGRPVFHPMPIDRALPLGVTSFEHAMAPWPAVLNDTLRNELDRLIEAHAAEEEVATFVMDVFGLGLDSVSVERLDALCAAMKGKNAFLCPTLHVFEEFQKELDEAARAEEPEQAEAVEARRETIATLQEMSHFFVTECNKRQVRLLVGQDGADPIATFSEMELLQQCGVSAADIIKGASLYPAGWMGVDDRLGSIAPGKEASLLVVDQNPLEDIKNLRSTFLVIQKGRPVFQAKD